MRRDKASAIYFFKPKVIIEYSTSGTKFDFFFKRNVFENSKLKMHL